ncbi:hypothetical protein ASU35_17995 [Acetivibrio ethanolgignens]|uniref:Uncharacterized protein n=1 Tax=Acetivibrio ethanolgignens TaxID=290052 RepID=A0A0V8QGR8_9FIRM|nr:hypothetical protein ASU35_17995 [Acetivibrio ethanolgignens]
MKKTALILRSKGDKDRLIYIADDVCKMCLDMLDLLHDKYYFYSEYLFPSSDPNTPLAGGIYKQKISGILEENIRCFRF